LETLSHSAAGVEVTTYEEQQEGGEYDEEYDVSNGGTCLQACQ
jgi:hypothetical protein